MNGHAQVYTTGEHVFGFFLVLLGTIFVALLIGEIANAFSNFNIAARECRFTNKLIKPLF